jgi:hypothetical protein
MRACSTRSTAGATTTVTDPSGPNAHLNARPRTYLYVLQLQSRGAGKGAGGEESARREAWEALVSGEARRVTVLGDVQSVHWSPDSRKLLIFSSPLQRYVATKVRRLFLPGGLRPRRRKEREAAKSLAEPLVVAMSLLDFTTEEGGSGPGGGGNAEGEAGSLVSETFQWIKPSAAMKDYIMAGRQGAPHASSPVKARGSLWSPSSDAVCWAGARASRSADSGDAVIDPEEGVWLQRVGRSRSGRPDLAARGLREQGADQQQHQKEGPELIHARGVFALWSHS